MSDPSDYERETRARLIRVEDCMSGLQTSQAIIGERLTAISARIEERHGAQLSALEAVRAGTGAMQSALLAELREQREYAQALAAGTTTLEQARWATLRDPRVIALLALLVLALTAPQLLPRVLGAVISDANPESGLHVAPEAPGSAGALRLPSDMGGAGDAP